MSQILPHVQTTFWRVQQSWRCIFNNSHAFKDVDYLFITNIHYSFSPQVKCFHEILISETRKCSFCLCCMNEAQWSETILQYVIVALWKWFSKQLKFHEFCVFLNTFLCRSFRKLIGFMKKCIQIHSKLISVWFIHKITWIYD